MVEGKYVFLYVTGIIQTNFKVFISVILTSRGFMEVSFTIIKWYSLMNSAII